MAASKIRERRLALGLRQLDVAIKSGFSLTTTRAAEMGYMNISDSARRKIARALRSTVEELFPKFEAADGTAETLAPGR